MRSTTTPSTLSPPALASANICPTPTPEMSTPTTEWPIRAAGRVSLPCPQSRSRIREGSGNSRSTERISGNGSQQACGSFSYSASYFGFDLNESLHCHDCAIGDLRGYPGESAEPGERPSKLDDPLPEAGIRLAAMAVGHQLLGNFVDSLGARGSQLSRYS